MGRDHSASHERRTFLRNAGSSLTLLALSARPHLAVAQQTPGSSMKIGMLGAGRMGSALGALFVKAGHPLMFASRHPDASFVSKHRMTMPLTGISSAVSD